MTSVLTPRYSEERHKEKRRSCDNGGRDWSDATSLVWSFVKAALKKNNMTPSIGEKKTLCCTPFSQALSKVFLLGTLYLHRLPRKFQVHWYCALHVDLDLSLATSQGLPEKEAPHARRVQFRQAPSPPHLTWTLILTGDTGWGERGGMQFCFQTNSKANTTVPSTWLKK